MPDFDLLLRGGHLLDPAQGIDAPMDVGFAGGKVAEIAPELAGGRANQVEDVSGYLVTPGLIDLHTHVYWGGTSLGIDVDSYCRASAVTTVVDTGSVGPGNFAGFRAHVIEQADPNILLFLHISHAGIYAFSNRVMVGESEEMRLMDPLTAIEVANANRDLIVGIKVRLGAWTSGIAAGGIRAGRRKAGEQQDLGLRRDLLKSRAAQSRHVLGGGNAHCLHAETEAEGGEVRGPADLRRLDERAGPLHVGTAGHDHAVEALQLRRRPRRHEGLDLQGQAERVGGVAERRMNRRVDPAGAFRISQDGHPGGCSRRMHRSWRPDGRPPQSRRHAGVHGQDRPAIEVEGEGGDGICRAVERDFESVRRTPCHAPVPGLALAQDQGRGSGCVTLLDLQPGALEPEDPVHRGATVRHHMLPIMNVIGRIAAGRHDNRTAMRLFTQEGLGQGAHSGIEVSRRRRLGIL